MLAALALSAVIAGSPAAAPPDVIRTGAVETTTDAFDIAVFC